MAAQVIYAVRGLMLIAVGFYVLTMLTGCAATSCFGVVAVNPPKQVAIIFDACRGEVIYQSLPPWPTDSAAPAQVGEGSI